MYKINFDDEEILIKYLKSFDDKWTKRRKILNKILETGEDDNLNYWDLSDSTTYGELFHKKYDSSTSLNRVSHIVKNVQKINDEYFAEIKVLNTCWGNEAKGLINEGFSLKLECVYHEYNSKKIIRIDINYDNKQRNRNKSK